MADVLTPPAAPMQSSVDMLSNVGDIFAGISDIPESGPSEDAPVEDEPAVVDDAPVEDAPDPIGEGETPAALEDEPAAEPIAAEPAAASPEDLPEGVTKGKDSKGRTKYFLDENRYKTIYDHHKAVQSATEIMGEPFSAEAFKLRNDAYLGQERLFNNLTSADPAAQADVMNFMLQEMKSAHEAGEVGSDPTIPFADTVYTTLRDQAPDAYAHLRMSAGKDFIGEMFDHAAKTGNSHLFSAAQHFAATLAGIGPKPSDMTDAQYAQQIREVTGRSGIPFHTLHEMAGLVKGEEPLSAAQKRIQELETQLNGRSQSGVTEQFTTWQNSHVQSVNSAVFEDAVKPALSSVEAAWKDFPEDYNRLVLDPLNREVAKTVQADTVLDQQVKDLNARARRATSEQVRQQIGDQIKQLFVNRAKLAADKAKGPILKFAAEALKGRSAQTHERRTSAQARTAPKGTGAPVRQSVLPTNMGFKNGVFNAADAVKQATALINGR